MIVIVTNHLLLCDILLTVVVPPRLVVTKREQLKHIIKTTYTETHSMHNASTGKSKRNAMQLNLGKITYMTNYKALQCNTTESNIHDKAIEA